MVGVACCNPVGQQTDDPATTPGSHAITCTSCNYAGVPTRQTHMNGGCRAPTATLQARVTGLMAAPTTPPQGDNSTSCHKPTHVRVCREVPGVACVGRGCLLAPPVGTTHPPDPHAQAPAPDPTQANGRRRSKLGGWVMPVVMAWQLGANPHGQGSTRACMHHPGARLACVTTSSPWAGIHPQRGFQHRWVSTPRARHRQHNQRRCSWGAPQSTVHGWRLAAHEHPAAGPGAHRLPALYHPTTGGPCVCVCGW